MSNRFRFAAFSVLVIGVSFFLGFSLKSQGVEPSPPPTSNETVVTSTTNPHQITSTTISNSRHSTITVKKLKPVVVPPVADTKG